MKLLLPSWADLSGLTNCPVEQIKITYNSLTSAIAMASEDKKKNLSFPLPSNYYNSNLNSLNSPIVSQVTYLLT